MSLSLSQITQSTLLRYQLIEIIAYWEGRLTTRHLCNGFALGRQQASRLINAYMDDIAPANKIYDQTLRGFKPTDNFRPKVTTGHVNEYLNLLRINRNLVSKSNYSALGLQEVHSVSPPSRYIEPIITRNIVRAIIQKKRVEIEYQTLANPEPETRVITPHSLFETPLRWYVRAYCEKNECYKNFILNRISNQIDLMDRTQHFLEDDIQWCTSCDLILQAEPLLNASQKKLIESDYDMKNGELIISTQQALIKYLLPVMGFTLSNITPTNERFLTIKNFREILDILEDKQLQLF